MRNKRFFGLIALAVLVMGLLAACQPATGGETNENTGNTNTNENTAATEAATEAPTANMNANENTSGSTGAPADCANENACVVIKPGDPIRIGFGGPLSGD